MKVVFLSAEVSPFAKVGGLADVVGSLPIALSEIGHDVRIVMPLYAMVEDDPRWNLELLARALPIPINGNWLEYATVKRGFLGSVPIYFIGHERFFRTATTSATVYTPGIEQYLFFTVAALTLFGTVDWKPEVVHCNDWHMGFIPVLLRERFGDEFGGSASILTIHNLAYQGEFGVEVLDALALPRSLFVADKLETWGGVNFLKSGCVYADQVNTVSPTYAKEIQTRQYGATLEGLMAFLAREGRLSGIPNGIDRREFNPQTDPHLAAHYSASDLSGKLACRASLLGKAGLPASSEPIVGAVTRLSSQKGLDLLAEAMPDLCGLGVRLVLQGLGDPQIAEAFRFLRRRFPSQVAFFEEFDEELARMIYAGSDMFVMPSNFEPCGLGQMIAMRYGTVPIVRATGGLADTIREGENGFVFQEPTVDMLVQAFERAVRVFRTPPEWRKLVQRGMHEDHGWTHSAHAYIELYERALNRRKRLAPTG